MIILNAFGIGKVTEVFGIHFFIKTNGKLYKFNNNAVKLYSVLVSG